MDFPCENEINVRNDNALRFAIVTKPTPVIEYLKTIASLIGASHILGVFEDDNFIKVYFDDKKFVDTLIRSGIHVMGHHIKVDYVVPPGSKVILSNIDPVVSNYDLIRLMSMFGSVVSPVFRSPISDDIELCHIDHGVRYLYMNINIPVPETLEFKYGDQICKINVKMEDSLPIISYVKTEPDESNTSESSSNATLSDSFSAEPIIVDNNNTDPINVDNNTDPIGVDNNTDPISVDNNTDPISVDNNTDSISVDDNLDITDAVVVSMKSATEEISMKQQSKNSQLHDETNKHKLHKGHHAKLRTSQTNTRIRPNVKYRNRRVKKLRIPRKKTVQNVACIKKLLQTPLKVQPASSVCSSSPDDSSMQLSGICDSFIDEDTKSILDEGQLKLLLEEVRCQREPMEIVKKYVGPDSDALRCLIKQLINLKKKTDDNAFKVRIRRLINNLKIFLDA